MKQLSDTTQRSPAGSEKRPERRRLKLAPGLAAGLIFCLLGCLLGAAAVLPGGLRLALTPVRGGAPLVSLQLAPGERFTIRYNHSVENAPIWETHSVDAGGRIYIEEERYVRFGAGMGKMPGVGRMVMEGGCEVIKDMHMPTGNFVLRIGSPGVDHTLIWRGREVNLSAMAPHSAVRFSASPISLLRRWTQPALQIENGK